MDSDIISRLKTPDGALVLLPYPTVTVDMGQYLARMKTPSEIEALWVDYVSELATEARADPGRERGQLALFGQITSAEPPAVPTST
jgi:allantoinase